MPIESIAELVFCVIMLKVPVIIEKLKINK